MPLLYKKAAAIEVTLSTIEKIEKSKISDSIYQGRGTPLLIDVQELTVIDGDEPSQQNSLDWFFNVLAEDPKVSSSEISELKGANIDLLELFD